MTQSLYIHVSEILLQRWRSLPKPHRLKSGLKHVPVMNAMSQHSISSESAKLPPYPKYLKKLPPWFSVPKPVHIKPDALKVFDADVSSFKALEKNMRTIFDNKIKTFLVARCLLSKFPMGACQMKKIHFVTKDIIGRFPNCVTSRTLMMVLNRCREDQQRSIPESLVQDHTLVVLDWTEDPKASTIEVSLMIMG